MCKYVCVCVTVCACVTLCVCVRVHACVGCLLLYDSLLFIQSCYILILTPLCFHFHNTCIQDRIKYFHTHGHIPNWSSNNFTVLCSLSHLACSCCLLSSKLKVSAIGQLYTSPVLTCDGQPVGSGTSSVCFSMTTAPVRLI